MPDPQPPQPPQRPQPQPPQPAPPGRRRLLAALKSPARSQLVVGLLLALVGFAAITQVRSNEIDDSYSGLRQQDLIDVLNGLAGTTQQTEAEITRLTRARTELQSDTSRRRAALEQAQQEADSLNVLAGLVPVTGPGIRVTITEETGTVQVSSLLDTVQELRTVGAEAIQFNGQVRVVAESFFEEGSEGIIVDGTPLEAPYVLDVIGEPGVLAGAINFPLGPLQQLQRDGASVETEELSSLDIESVRAPEQPDFAEPDPGQ